MKNTDWYKFSTICPGAPAGVYFGITQFGNIPDAVHPERMMKKDSTVIWVPEKKAHVGIASYVEAQRGEEVAKAKLVELGIPLNARFGYSPSDDLTSTYVVRSSDAPRRGRKPGSGCPVKVMRAQFAASYEDGTRFRPGDVVKITFRKKFVKNDGGSKTFQNMYERPSKEELDAFLAEEAKTR